jgi:hypothetical protein
MKKKLLLPACWYAIFFCACSDSPRSNNATGTINENTGAKGATGNSGQWETNVISFKINGQLVKTSGWNISTYRLGKSEGVNITSNMHEDARTVVININGLTSGTYNFTYGIKNITAPGVAYGSYRADYLKDMLNSYHFESGQFTITAIDTVNGILNGSFSGKAKNSNGIEVDITEGKVMNGKLKHGAVFHDH